MKKQMLLIAACVAISVPALAQSRGTIKVVGSSTVYPFATVVAEQFGKSSDFKTPTIEATGSGGGLKLFCAGVGVEHPDIVNTSRRIKQSEVDQCKSNGVADIIEIKIGYDGIILAGSKKAQKLSVSRLDIFLALAKDVPNPDGSESLVPNSAKTWKDVNADLPAIAIEVLGPPPTSGTRDAFVELAMEGGCAQIDWIKTIKVTDKQRYKAICHTVREDGAYVEAGENDNLIVQKLDANPKALGIFGFSFLEQNSDKIHGSVVDGVEPEFELIADGSYPISRALYFYVKKAHVTVIPGMGEFLAEFTSEKAWGEEGYLTDRGMIPMLDEERSKFASDAADLNTLGTTLD